MRFPAPAFYVLGAVPVAVLFERRATFAVVCERSFEAAIWRHRAAGLARPDRVVVPAGSVAFVDKCDISFAVQAG